MKSLRTRTEILREIQDYTPADMITEERYLQRHGTWSITSESIQERSRMNALLAERHLLKTRT